MPRSEATILWRSWWLKRWSDDEEHEMVLKSDAEIEVGLVLCEQDQKWRKWGIIEVAVRNVNVSSYMDHWEGRALKAEAELARLREGASNSIAMTHS